MPRQPASSLVLEPGRRHAPDVRALLDAAEAFSRALYPPQSRNMADAAALDDPSVRFRVVRGASGTALGCGAVAIAGDGTGELERMFVAPQARRRGVGAFLLAGLEEIACGEGVRVLRLETGLRQPEAIALYRRFGFVERGPFGAHRADPLCIFMEKRLPGRAPP